MSPFPIAIAGLCAASIELESGAGGGRPKWPGCRITILETTLAWRRGAVRIQSGLIWNEWRQSWQKRGRCRNVTQRRIASQRHICCSVCQQLLCQRTGSKLTYGDPLMRFLAPECSQGGQCCQVWRSVGRPFRKEILTCGNYCQKVQLLMAIKDKVFENEVDDTSQGSRGLQWLQTQWGEEGSQGSPLCKSWTSSRETCQLITFSLVYFS